MEKQTRGALTRQVQRKAAEILGREITVTELRLMPYIQYTMMNSQRLDRAKLSGAEMDVLDAWEKSSYIEYQATGALHITKRFWNALCEILYTAYVDIDRQ